MKKYIFKRLINGLLSIIAIIIIISSIIYIAPVDPASLSFGQRNNKETIDALKRKYYLDQPIHKQIIHYLGDISIIQWITSDDERLKDYSYNTMLETTQHKLILKTPYLRQSYVTGQQVAKIIKEAIFPTIILAFTAILIAILLGIPLGLYCAKQYNTISDQLIQSLCTLGFSVPSYISAIVFSIIFGYILGPCLGLEIQGGLVQLDDFGDYRYHWQNLILPSIALGIRPISVFCQMTRTTVLDIMNLDYIRTAKAKGLPKSRINLFHILRNALNPLVSTISGWFASLLSGAFFVEYVFNYSGLGTTTINALNQYDIPVVLACSLTIACIFILINIFSDILYFKIDPKVQLE